MKYGKSHRAYLSNIADQPVSDASSCAAADRGCAEEFAPGRDAVCGAAAGYDCHIARSQIIYEPYFDLIRILALAHVISGHIQPGARTPEHNRTLVEGPNKRKHRLLSETEPV